MPMPTRWLTSTLAALLLLLGCDPTPAPPADPPIVRQPVRFPPPPQGPPPPPPLVRAVESDDLAACQKLLAEGGDAAQVWKDQPLPHRAVRRGQLPILQALIGAGAAVDLADAEGITPLQLACARGELPIARWLLAQGASLTQADAQGRLALHHAVRRPEVVRWLLQAGASPAATDKAGQPPLHHAAASGALLSARALLAAGAKIDTTDADGRTALEMALSQAHPRNTETFRYLRQQPGARIGAPRFAWEQACARRDLAVAVTLLELAPPKGDEIAATLRLAASHGANKIAQLLIDEVESLDAADPQTGHTALHLAAARGDYRLVGALLRAGASPDRQDEAGRSALHLAAAGGWPRAARALLAGKTRLALADAEGATAAELAAVGPPPKADLRQIMPRHLATLEALLASAPAEARARVGAIAQASPHERWRAEVAALIERLDRPAGDGEAPPPPQPR